MKTQISAGQLNGLQQNFSRSKFLVFGALTLMLCSSFIPHFFKRKNKLWSLFMDSVQPSQQSYRATNSHQSRSLLLKTKSLGANLINFGRMKD